MASYSAGGISPIGSSRRRLLNQSAHLRVAYSTCSTFLHGARFADQLGLVQAINRFAQRIVIAVANAPNRGGDTRLGQTVAVADRQIWVPTG